MTLPSIRDSVAALVAILGLSVSASHETHMPGDVEASTTSLRYGHCYTINNAKREELGHQPGAWGYLRFGTGNKRTTFRVCESLGRCKPSHPSPYREILRSPARFWLFDIEGNEYSKDGAFVAADSQPFSSSGLTYPAGTSYRYYINFWGENDDCDTDRRYLGNCGVKLRVDNLRDDKGLAIGNDYYLRVVASADSYVNVTFHERECPEYKDAAVMGEL
ncbi:hypothetical protein L249_5201 [Ophiocordyceps polyrhachis-furcata BCC 54312]|uniref:Uncharacterized protein n=1 Tax=Ophiocordyceps polyrhachis-furcata BCC 54312 TaxID=1330021 RepID=A0A367L8Z2_9HYPO|nr:hypothetical protein L249_5201 [Ophiocordyceps polyrhachis-furcata BCC 54312]